MTDKHFCHETIGTKHLCLSDAAFVAGAPDKPATPVCAAHLAKATRAQAKLHDVDIVLVKVLPARPATAPAT